MKKAWTALVLTVTLSLGLAAPAAAAGSFADVPAGTKIGNLYATDIAAVWDGAVVPSYNIGGRTAVVLPGPGGLWLFSGMDTGETE